MDEALPPSNRLGGFSQVASNDIRSRKEPGRTTNAAAQLRAESKPL